MIIFKKIYIKNFFRVKEEIVIDLYNQGLVLISGWNADSSTSASNGSGKSTIFEAILWCLWGKTVRKYSTDQVINSTVGKNCRVILIVEVDGIIFTITRHRKHGKEKDSLSVLTKKDISGHTNASPQKLIDELLGIDYETFIRGPMMPQGSFKRFSEMTDSESKKILDQTIRTDIFFKAQKIVNQKLNDIHNSMHDDRKTITSIEDQITEIKEEIIELKEKEKGFGKSLEAKIKKQNLRLDNINDKIEELNYFHTSVKDINLMLKKAEKSLEEHNDKIYDLNKQGLSVNKDKEKLQKLKSLLYDVDHKLRNAEAEKNKIEDLDPGAVCGTCLQEIDEDHVESCLEEAEKHYKKIEKNKTKIEKSVKKQRTKYRKVKKEYEKKLNSYDTITDSMKSNIRRLKTEKELSISNLKEIKRLKKNAEEIKSDIEDIERESPYSDMISKKLLKIKLLNKKLRKSITSLALLKNNKKYYDFWSTGFSNKGIKNLVLNSITPFLNRRAKYYSSILTNNELDIIFETQKLLKSGEWRDSFSVAVNNKNGATDYSGNSGGEKGKANLAINFTISDLFSARSQKAFPQRFFDEPFDGLDELGVEAAVDLLTKMADQAGSIFIITHNSEFVSLFDNVITIKKQNGVSYVS
jgi:DNA repair exonuclease SbcCD ATPase subunit